MAAEAPNGGGKPPGSTMRAATSTADLRKVTAEEPEEGLHIRQVDPPPRPPAGDRFRRQITLHGAVIELFNSREMVRSVAERDLRARYKQTYLGYAWAVLTPLLLMIVFTVFFQRVAKVNTEGAPYVLFSYLGLIPWGFFSTSVNLGGNSLIAATPLLNKVYCPREVFPLGSVTLAMVDTGISVVMLATLFAITGYTPRPEALWLPVLWMIQIWFTAGLVLFVSSVVVYFRDLRALIPLALQLGLFATPVAYSLEKVPSAVRPFYVAVNPMAEVIDASRRTALLGQSPVWNELAIALAASFGVLLAGYWVFKKLEGGLADVV